MSSDESAKENGVKQYRILKKSWRSPQLTAWIRVFDAINRENRVNPLTKTSRGAEPRPRFQSNKTDNRTPPVPGLPHNAYDQIWYNDLTPHKRLRVQAKKKAYDFTHTPEIIMSTYTSILDRC